MVLLVHRCHKPMWQCWQWLDRCWCPSHSSSSCLPSSHLPCSSQLPLTSPPPTTCYTSSFLTGPCGACATTFMWCCVPTCFWPRYCSWLEWRGLRTRWSEIEAGEEIGGRGGGTKQDVFCVWSKHSPSFSFSRMSVQLLLWCSITSSWLCSCGCWWRVLSYM